MAHLQVDIIETHEDLALVSRNWDAVYARDPDANFFLSTSWMSKRLTEIPQNWFVLAARPNAINANYIAFFPMRRITIFTPKQGFETQIAMAGNNVADYTGLICDPDHEDEAIAAFMRTIKKLKWREFNLERIRISKHRRELLLDAFAAPHYATRHLENRFKAQNTNNAVCPYVALPETWEEFLQRLSANTRQKCRRFLKKIENSDEFEFRWTDGDSIQRDTEALVFLWDQQWGGTKVQNRNNVRAAIHESINRIHRSGNLLMLGLWHQDRPLGVISCYLDPAKRVVGFVVGGRDREVNNPAPGIALHAHAIRWAIANGYRTYDFLRGDEPYKYSFASGERIINNDRIIACQRQHEASAGDISQDDIRKCVERLAARRDFVRADDAYQTWLTQDPGNELALFGAAQIKAVRGKHEHAVELYERLLVRDSDTDRVWPRYAKSLLAIGDYQRAAEALRTALENNPNSPEFHTLLGRALFKLGQVDNAISSFDAALTLEPDYTKALVSRGNVLFAAGMLPHDEKVRIAELNAQIGSSYSRAGRHKSALACFAQATRMAPQASHLRDAFRRACAAASKRATKQNAASAIPQRR